MLVVGPQQLLHRPLQPGKGQLCNPPPDRMLAKRTQRLAD